MQQLVIATHNLNKYGEICKILHPLQEHIALLFGGDLCEEHPSEDGVTFVKNACIKANFFLKVTRLPSLADDSGLIVDALNGEPGVYSSRYAGPLSTDKENNLKLLDNMKDIPENMSDAKFVCTAVLLLPNKQIYIADGELSGKIVKEPRGKAGFGYDPIFELPIGKTVAEISFEEKNRISHRYKAFKQIKEILRIYF